MQLHQRYHLPSASQRVRNGVVESAFNMPEAANQRTRPRGWTSGIW